MLIQAARDADALDNAITELINKQLNHSASTPDSITLYEFRKDIEQLTSKWFRYGEMVTLTIDTNRKTCEIEEI